MIFTHKLVHFKRFALQSEGQSMLINLDLISLQSYINNLYKKNISCVVDLLAVQGDHYRTNT